MKRQAEYLVRKRDGRCEWLRATKLARSVHAALAAAGSVTRERSLDLATEVVGRLRRERSGDEVVGTAQIATVARRVLIERGYSLAALLFAEFGSRRAATLEDRGTLFWSDERLFGTS